MSKLTRDELLARADQMTEIQDEMRELIQRARQALRGTETIEYRAEAYWLGHIEGFLDDEDRSCTSIPDTINELTAAAGDDPESCPECGCTPGDGYTEGCKACGIIVGSYDAAG